MNGSRWRFLQVRHVNWVLRTFNNQRKGIIRQGYLSKQGHIIRNWKKRSFVLMRDELRYYKSETEKKPQGKIRMEDIVEWGL